MKKSRRWRVLIGATLLLLIGAAINLTVAWGCTWRYFQDPPWGDMRPLAPGEHMEWFWKPPYDMPVTDVRVVRMPGVQFDGLYSMEAWPDPPTGGTGRRSLQGEQVFRAGWPCMAFRWTNTYDGNAPEKDLPVMIDARSVMLASWDRGVLIWQSPTKRIPMRHVMTMPIMPSGVGFVLNTLLYAALALGLWRLVVRGPRVIRRRMRRRRGRCVGCGYELGGLGRCPECGVEPGARAPAPS